MNNNLIKIEEISVYGVQNPFLVIKAVFNEPGYTFKILSENDEVDYHTLPIPQKNGICVQAELNNNQKELSLFVTNGIDMLFITTIKNTKIKRIRKTFSKKIGSVLRIPLKIIKGFKKLIFALGRGLKFLWKEYHFIVPRQMWGKYYKELKQKVKYIISGDLYYNPLRAQDYNKWLQEKTLEKEKIADFDYEPKISILIPVYNISRVLLSACIDSILGQSYHNFEVCLSDDASTNLETLQVLNDYENKDSRIKVHYRKKNGHISNATNDALKMATGEFVGLVDNDDILDKDALYEVVSVLNDDKAIDMIYSDEDKIGLDGKFCDPHFKPDFSPDTLLSSNYICHFAVLRKSIMNDIGGFRVGLEGAQDYDLFLRFIQKTKNVYHIPKVLYHWRMVEGSTSMAIDNKNYAVERGRQAVQDYLNNNGVSANVRLHSQIPYNIVEYLYEKEPKISIIIPTRDYADILENCLKSIYSKTEYTNFEVVVVNNGSKRDDTIKLFDNYVKEHSNFKVIDADIPFNYSKLNNLAVQQVNSDYIVLLNNDTEIITPQWLSWMVGYAMQEHIGCVGAKLYYEDNTVQHAGIVLGVGGVASHAFLGASKDEFGLYARLSIPYNYSGNTAACLMVERRKYLEVNGLEEELMVAYNDVDFNLKLLSKGYYNVFLPQVKLFHLESKSRGLDTTKEKYAKFLEEQYYMNNKWSDLIQNDPFYNSNFSREKSFVLEKKGAKK